MTPATVQHAFVRAGVPIVRYAPGSAPELDDAHGCWGLDYAGGGIVASLAPRTGPTFELIVFRTRADATEIASLFRPGGRIRARRRGPLVLFTMHTTARLRRVLGAFVAASRT
jgi:hypothetical protein